jgi:hypothetical protein
VRSIRADLRLDEASLQASLEPPDPAIPAPPQEIVAPAAAAAPTAPAKPTSRRRIAPEARPSLPSLGYTVMRGLPKKSAYPVQCTATPISLRYRNVLRSP